MNNNSNNCGDCGTTCSECGRPWAICKQDGGCGCNKCKDIKFCEYGRMANGCIREKQPGCPMQAVIPSVTIESIDGIKNLADCLVHVSDINTTFYIDDKHRPIITWAGPIDIPGYDMEGNPNNYRDQIVTDVANQMAVIYDKSGKGYMFGLVEDIDLQEQVDNKLDKMAEDGTLQEIIGSYLNTTAVWGFDNVSDMKSSSNLINGSYAQTLGYHTKNDGGGAIYKIRTITNDDVVDEMAILEMETDDTLIAELIIGDEVNVKQCGCYADGTTDDSTKIATIFSTFLPTKRKIYFPDGVYAIENSINVPVENYSYIQLESNAELKATDTVNEIFKIDKSASYFTIDGGIFNCNSKANYAINSTSANNKYSPTYKNIFVKNSVTSGFISRDPAHSGGSEHGFIINCKFYNPDTLSECVTLYAGDYVIDNCEMFYTNLGIRCSTILTISNTHIWAGGALNPNNNTIGIRFTGIRLIANDMYFDGINHCIDTITTSTKITANNILDFLPDESTVNNPVVFNITKSSLVNCTGLNIYSYSTRVYKINISDLDTKNLNNTNCKLVNVIEQYDNSVVYDKSKVDYGNNIFVSTQAKAITKAYSSSVENGNYYRIGSVILKDNSVTGGNIILSGDDLNKYTQEIFFSLYLYSGTVTVQSNVSKYYGTEGKMGFALGAKESITNLNNETVDICPIYLHVVDNPGNQFGISVQAKIDSVGNWIEFFPYQKLGTAISSPTLLFDDVSNT